MEIEIESSTYDIHTIYIHTFIHTYIRRIGRNQQRMVTSGRKGTTLAARRSRKKNRGASTPLVRVSPGLLACIRCAFSAIFLISALYKLAYLNLASLTRAYYAEDAAIPLETLFDKPPVEFWPGIPCVQRFDDALRHYLLLAPATIAWLRPWYPVAFLVGAMMELVGAVLFVLGHWLGARLILVVMGVVTLVMHPVWDAAAWLDAVRNMSLASGLLLSEMAMRGVP